MKTPLEKTLATLVSMPTLSDDCKENERALDYIESLLRGAHMYTRRYTFDGHGALVAASRKDNFKHPAVLLAAHADVVPGDAALFTLQTRDGKFFGRGVYDMKFAVASYIQLAAELADRITDYDFAIMITTDEEYGGRDGVNGTRRLVEEGYRPRICIIPDAAAPNWNIEAATKGSWRLTMAAEGKVAHDSRPWEGDSATFRLIDALGELKQHFRDQGPSTDTLNIAMLEAGKAYNQIPAQAHAMITIRLADNTSHARYTAIMEDISQRHGVQIETRSHNRAIRSNPSDALVRAFADSVASVTGRQPDWTLSNGGSDAAYFHALGIPHIVTTPLGGGHHSEQEWVDRASLEQFVPILRSYLEHLRVNIHSY